MIPVTARGRLLLVAWAMTLVVIIGWTGEARPASASPSAIVASGACDWLRPHLAAADLPVETFVRIAARESGCSVTGVHVADRDDLSVSRFGVNFRTRSLRAGWRRLCGVTNYTQLRDVNVDVRCTAAAYRTLGLRPWRTR